jgi:hypothetical protein
LLREPSERIDFGAPNPCGFLFGVRMRIVGMQVASATLFLFIGVSHMPVGAQIIPEGEMSHYVG